MVGWYEKLINGNGRKRLSNFKMNALYTHTRVNTGQVQKRGFKALTEALTEQ